MNIKENTFISASVSMGSGEYVPLNYLTCDGASWWLHGGLFPTHRVAMYTSLARPEFAQAPHQPLRHQFPSSSVGDEFKRI